MLVRTVTASNSGGFVSPAISFLAAESMAGPPPAWSVSMRAPRLAAERTAPATVLGMSCNLRSRKTFSGGDDFLDDRGAGGYVKLEAHFEPGACVVELLDEADGGVRVGHVEGDDEAVAGGGIIPG